LPGGSNVFGVGLIFLIASGFDLLWDLPFSIADFLPACQYFFPFLALILPIIISSKHSELQLCIQNMRTNRKVILYACFTSSSVLYDATNVLCCKRIIKHLCIAYTYLSEWCQLTFVQCPQFITVIFRYHKRRCRPGVDITCSRSPT